MCKRKWVGKLALLSSAFVAITAHASEEFDSNEISVRWGNAFHEPDIDKPITKRIFNFTHAGRDSLGKNLFSGDLLISNSEDPATGGGGGAHEAYAFYQRTFSLSALSGRDIGGGLFRDVSVYGRFDANTKDTDFAPRVRKYRLGLSLDLPVSAGFWEISLGAYREQNHNGIIIPGIKPTGTDVAFRTVPEFMSSWLIPLGTMGSLGSFEGFADYVQAKGKNGFGIETAAEIHAQATLMFNLGGAHSHWQIGAGIEHWIHKYGESGTGSRQSTGLLLLRYKL